MFSRRWFLRTSGMAVGLLGTSPMWLMPGAAQGATRRKILVAVFQRGAADSLNVVAPFFEKRYSQLRPGIGVPAPGPQNGGIDLDGRFAFNPAMQPLKPLWDSGQLAVVHATGSPDPSRSHFDAQEFMESGTPGMKLDDGWLNRAIPLVSENASPMRAIAVGTKLPRTLSGDRNAMVVDDLNRFQVGSAESATMLKQLYASSSDPRMKAQGAGVFEAIHAIEALRAQPYTPANGAQYQSDFGRRLMQVARLIKADVGVEVAFVDLDGWDHHTNESGALPNLLRDFSTSLAAFSRDLGDRIADVVVVTMSEFGRTAAENGTGGTDHGHGGLMMVLGGPVKGGSVYGRWPGLEPEQLFEGRDLAVTTDFRSVLSELVHGHLGQTSDRVFPGFTPETPLGLLRQT
jgi:uncharacterized protein (DUF1501 family)